MISDDQRSIGSIGYITGNMGYSGDVYDQASNSYALWKPPNGCFPRGEAPPPYEEVIGLSQSNPCGTVSLGQHRTLPLSICSEAAVSVGPSDYQGFVPQPMQSATTNLINISINNAGTITSVAAGETHQQVHQGATAAAATTTTTSSSNSNNMPSLAAVTTNPYK